MKLLKKKTEREIVTTLAKSCEIARSLSESLRQAVKLIEHHERETDRLRTELSLQHACRDLPMASKYVH